MHRLTLSMVVFYLAIPIILDYEVKFCGVCFFCESSWGQWWLGGCLCQGSWVLDHEYVNFSAWVEGHTINMQCTMWMSQFRLGVPTPGRWLFSPLSGGRQASFLLHWTMAEALLFQMWHSPSWVLAVLAFRDHEAIGLFPLPACIRNLFPRY